MRLESRMFKETAKRIREGLLSSLEGGALKWLQGLQVPNPLLHTGSSAKAAVTSSIPVSGEKNTSAAAGSVSGGKIGGISVHSTTSAASAATPLDASAYNFDHATSFLTQGFEELLMCRCVSVVRFYG